MIDYKTAYEIAAIAMKQREWQVWYINGAAHAAVLLAVKQINKEAVICAIADTLTKYERCWLCDDPCDAWAA